jgi:hypothetical protein
VAVTNPPPPPAPPPVVPTVPPAPVLRQVLVNGKAPRAARVVNLTLVFDGVVRVARGAFGVLQTSRNSRSWRFTTRVQTVRGKTRVTLRFVGPGLQGGYLPAGRYMLLLQGSKLRNVAGQPLAGNRYVLFSSLNGRRSAAVLRGT